MHGRSPALMEAEKDMLTVAVWYQARIAVAFSKFITGNILYKAIYIKGPRDIPLLSSPSMIYSQPR